MSQTNDQLKMSKKKDLVDNKKHIENGPLALSMQPETIKTTLNG